MNEFFNEKIYKSAWNSFLYNRYIIRYTITHGDVFILVYPYYILGHKIDHVPQINLYIIKHYAASIRTVILGGQIRLILIQLWL